MKPITIAIAGCGSRGQDTYAACQERFSDKMKIVAAADIRPEKLKQMKEKYGLSDDQLFDSAESMLKAGKLAEIMIIATPDRLHYQQAMDALKLDYHLLLEKPISPSAEECRDIEKLAMERNREVVVCHVLRYTVFYQKLKELVETVVGEVMSIQAIERVAHWHQAHSFVRGNWRSAEETTPMILAKCCHDMDILLWLAGKKCEKVSSFGSLGHFTSDHAPEGAALRCMDCKVENCPYNAVDFYVGKVKEGKLDWPVNVLTIDLTEEGVLEALKTGPYGRCVYHCDNDVVDHQVVNLLLEGGATINFTMCAFTKECARQIRIMGTRAEIIGDMEKNTIEVLPFAGVKQLIDVNTLTSDFSGHGGGDARMLEDLLDLVAGERTGGALTSISRSVESHLAALAAEESRLAGGKVIDI